EGAVRQAAGPGQTVVQQGILIVDSVIGFPESIQNFLSHRIPPVLFCPISDYSIIQKPLLFVKGSPARRVSSKYPLCFFQKSHILKRREEAFYGFGQAVESSHIAGLPAGRERRGNLPCGGV
ncbi:hypothetical protein LPJCHP_LPJCHP_08840, partial [Dysosmobacter welbionis]